MRRTILLFLILALATAAQAFTLLPAGGGDKCEKCIRRCEREQCGTPLPSPTPTLSPSPKPTSVPLPCEPVGGRKDYVDGQERMLCFDAGDKRALMEVSVKSQPSCGGELAAELRAPSGARSYSLGPQPNTVLPWEAGKWYLWTRMEWGNCSPFTFTPR